jgi:hypothetical protein
MKKKKFHVQDVLKIVDIWHEDVSPDTKAYLHSVRSEYRKAIVGNDLCEFADREIKVDEPMYDISIIVSDIHTLPPCTQAVMKELIALDRICRRRDAAYVRFVIY